MNKIILAFAVIILGACSQNKATEERKDPLTKTEQLPEAKTKAQESHPFEKANIDVKIIPSQENTFGYEIWIDGKRTIIQNTIPSVQGNKGFATEGKARKTGLFVISKIRKNQMPPSVSQKELDSLGVL